MKYGSLRRLRFLRLRFLRLRFLGVRCLLSVIAHKLIVFKLSVSVHARSEHFSVGSNRNGSLSVSKNMLHVPPLGDITLSYIIQSHSDYGSVRPKAYSMLCPCRDSDNIIPIGDITLSMTVISCGDNSAFRAKSNCVSAPCRYGDKVFPFCNCLFAVNFGSGGDGIPLFCNAKNFAVSDSQHTYSIHAGFNCRIYSFITRDYNRSVRFYSYCLRVTSCNVYNIFPVFNIALPGAVISCCHNSAVGSQCHSVKASGRYPDDIAPLSGVTLSILVFSGCTYISL